MRRKLTAVGAVAGVALALGGAAIAGAAGGGDDDDGRDRSITGAALRQAEAAALKEVGGGTVTDTEAGDEESYYEVEVTRADGTQLDVQLDRAFRVVSSAGDRDE